jgi:alpha,alpha-trehalase
MVGLPHPRIHTAVLVLLLIRATAMAAPTAGGNEGGSRTLLGLLQRVQSEALRVLGAHDFDPKLYVDLPLATDERAAAAALPPRPSRAEFVAYLARYFGAVESDLLAADPPDFDPEPRGFLPRVESPQARAWALEVHALWKELARRVAPAVAAQPERHTLLPLPGRVVMPGSRFRELYYWDSYWVVRSARSPPLGFNSLFFLKKKEMLFPLSLLAT